MKYMGSKNRIASEIIPYFIPYLEKGYPFIDACCGGCNLIDKIPNKYKRYANDYNVYLIAMWKDLLIGVEFPEIIERDFYVDVRESYKNKTDKYTDGMKGWVGFMTSYNGRFFDGGYSGHNVIGKTGTRNYILENINNIKIQLPNLFGVKFTNKNILDINPNKPSVIYCDIPYQGTKEYSTSKFNYNDFYLWCNKMYELGHIVFLSEYNAPTENFKEIWSKIITIGMKNGDKARNVEKLFIYKKES